MSLLTHFNIKEKKKVLKVILILKQLYYKNPTSIASINWNITFKESETLELNSRAARIEFT